MQWQWEISNIWLQNSLDFVLKQIFYQTLCADKYSLPLGTASKEATILPSRLDTSLIVLLFVRSSSTFLLIFCFFSEVRAMVILTVLIWYPRNMISSVGIKMDFSGCI